jgi:hypothetical protein
MKTTFSTSETPLAILRPIAIPIGVESEKRKMKMQICSSEKPVFAKAAPRETAAQVL